MARFTVYVFILVVSIIVTFVSTNNTVLSVVTGLLGAAVLVIIDQIIAIYNNIWLSVLCNTVYRKSLIRLSISYLYKIKIKDKYLLIRGHRVKDQFQPVGGVYKRYKSSNGIFRKLKILDDEHMPIDDISKDDLRILVPAPNVIRFLKWFNSKSDREVNPVREFHEELVRPGILSKKNFSKFDYHHIDKHETRIKYSEHFQCHEILIAEIYEIEFDKKQIKELKNLMTSDSTDYVWLDANTIRKKGYNKDRNVRISDTSNWIL